MEIEISKYDSQSKSSKSDYYPILSYKTLVSNTSLLLIREGSMDISEETASTHGNFLEIYKVQFIAACKTEIADNLIVAFYVGEYLELHPYILSGLHHSYAQSGDRFFLIDYKSYVEICELTGETKLSLTEYLQQVKAGSLGINTLLSYNDQYLNSDQQKELWKRIDEKQVAVK